MGKTLHLYRLEITYPEGSHDEDGRPVPGCTPKGMTTPEWFDFPYKDWVVVPRPYVIVDGLVVRYDWTFRWPRQKLFRSWDGARSRARLFERYGCIVEISRSKPIEWETEYEHLHRDVRSTKAAIMGMQRILACTES